jgi:hypothetical protein
MSGLNRNEYLPASSSIKACRKAADAALAPPRATRVQCQPQLFPDEALESRSQPMIASERKFPKANDLRPAGAHAGHEVITTQVPQQ